MKTLCAVIALMLLVSCGKDGAPIRPTASAGVTVGTNGVSTNANVGVRKGPISVIFGL